MATTDLPNSNTKVKVKNLSLYNSPDVKERLHPELEVPALQQKISQARRSIIDYMQPIEGAVGKAIDSYRIGKAHSIGWRLERHPDIKTRFKIVIGDGSKICENSGDCLWRRLDNLTYLDTIEYIQSDPAVLARVGVISVAALGGVVAAYRGGPLRKLFYSTFAGVSVAAVCYPREAVEWGTKGVDVTTTNARGLYKSFFPTAGDQNAASNTVLDIEKLGISAGKIDDNRHENLEDHGQSKPEDSDLYSTRSS